MSLQTALFHGSIEDWLASKITDVFCDLPTTSQLLFLVPLIGGRYHIIPQLAVYTTYIPLIVLANWVILWYLPPSKGTRKLH